MPAMQTCLEGFCYSLRVQNLWTEQSHLWGNFASKVFAAFGVASLPSGTARVCIICETCTFDSKGPPGRVCWTLGCSILAFSDPGTCLRNKQPFAGLGVHALAFGLLCWSRRSSSLLASFRVPSSCCRCFLARPRRVIFSTTTCSRAGSEFDPFRPESDAFSEARKLGRAKSTSGDDD